MAKRPYKNIQSYFPEACVIIVVVDSSKLFDS